MLRKLFGKEDRQQKQRELTIEDLVTLERYSEAASRLEARVKKQPDDLHAHLKLAEVYVELKNLEKAIDRYAYVADSYVADGFFNKGIALLGKAAKLVPGDDMMPRRIESYRRLKNLDRRRRLAIEGMKANTSTTKAAGNSAVELEVLWNQIVKSHLVEALSPEQLKNLFSVMEMHKVERGKVLGEAGALDPRMFLIVNGVVEATAMIDDQPMSIREFTTGDIVGENALLKQSAWPATYTVESRGTVFCLDRAGFEKVMTGNEDPRGFISTLRRQDNDRDVAGKIAKIRAR